MFKHSTRIAAVSILAMSAAATAWADDAPAAAKAPAGPSLTDILTNSGITVTGYVDASYLDSVTSKGQDTHELTYREFDTDSNTFALNQAALTIAYQPMTGLGGLVNVIMGRDAQYLPGSYGQQFSVTQAFAQYVVSTWTLQAGKFLTLAGAEVIAPTGNTNTSRSLMFFGEPLTHTGVRATDAINDKFSLILGINNGWASCDGDNSFACNTGKTGEVGVSFTPNKAFSLAVQGYYGSEDISPTLNDEGNVHANRTLLDAVATYNATSALTIVGSVDYGAQANFDGYNHSASYYAGALYINYAINDTWRLSLRGEYVDDDKSYFYGLPDSNPYSCSETDVCSYTSNKLNEETLTVGYDPVKNFEVRLEGRVDSSTNKVFYEGNDTYDKSQTTIGLEALYKFGTM